MIPSPPNGPARSHSRRTKARRSSSEAKSRGVIAATKMSFFEPCAFRISATEAAYPQASGAEGVLPSRGAEQRGAGRAERRIGGKAHPLGVVSQRHPGPVEHVGGQGRDTEPVRIWRGVLALPAGHGEEEGDPPAAGHVVHDVRERHVLGLNGDAGLGRGDPDRRLDDRLPVGQLAGRRFVRTVPVTRIGPLPQQEASVSHQQEDDIHDDPAAMLNLRSDRGVAGSAHSDRLAARPNPNPYLGPCPAHIRLIRTAQEQARYLRRSVDRHVHKSGQAVDEAGKTIYGLWIRSRTVPGKAATGAVENRTAMWMTAAENS